MIKQLTIIAFISGLFHSCIKEKDKPDLVADNTNMLTAGVWHFTYYNYYGGIPSTVTTYADLPNCRKDDLRIFNKDGTGEYNEGPTKCDSIYPQTQPVQWKFLNKYASSINLNGEEYYIDKLDAHEFRIHLKHLDPYAPEISFGYSR